MGNHAAIIPLTTTPAALAESLGVSPRRVQDEVRALGCYCKIGGKIIMRADHVHQFMEAMECPSKSTGAAKSGTTQAQLPVGDYAALVAQRTKQSPKGSRRQSKTRRGDVILMDRGRS